jgi:hypothetical protein
MVGRTGRPAAASIARRIASGVLGSWSEAAVRGGPKEAIASRRAVITPIASISGGSPTALLPWMTPGWGAPLQEVRHVKSSGDVAHGGDLVGRRAEW